MTIRNVEMTKTAQNDIDNIYQYLETKWSTRTKISFSKKLFKTIDILRTNPESFPKTKAESTIYKCVITKQNTLYYKFTAKKITILAIFDTRQNPKKKHK